jgi:ABC-type branched-subunit amino acid transport system ATPase component
MLNHSIGTVNIIEAVKSLSKEDKELRLLIYKDNKRLIDKILARSANDSVINVDENIANLTPVEQEQLFELMKNNAESFARQHPDLHILELLKKGRVDQARQMFFNGLAGN